MSYLETIYPEDLKNSYPKRLCDYLINRFWTSENCENILDIGCGRGIQLKHLCESLSARGFGVDEEIVKSSEFEIRECDFESERLPFEDNFFDLIFSKSVCEHVRNTENFFSETYRVLKPGGVFICITPDWASQMKNFYDDFTHVQPFTIKSMKNCMKIYGFDVQCCEYFYQLPFVWKHSWMKIFPPIISLLPDSLKWKNENMVNTKDRKLIRFSKEKMILAVGLK